MADDIVNRLRAEFDGCTCSGFSDCDCEQCHKRLKCDLYDLVGQAADEIERLRTEITELQTRLRDTYKERDYWEWASRGQ